MKNIMIPILVIVVCLSAGCNKDDYISNHIGVTFTKIDTETETNYILDGNIVYDNEIVGYDSTQHIFLLSEAAGERIRSEEYPVSPTPFAIAVDGDLIYIANFIPGYSSISCEDCITIEPYTYDNKYRVILGYPSSNLFSGIDPRNDERIILRFKRDNRLIDIEK